MKGREGQGLVHEESMREASSDDEVAVQLTLILRADQGPARIGIEVIQEF